METLVRRIQETRVEPGSLAVFWLGQAGFVFKTPAGKIVYSDPYFTDYVQRALPEYGLAFKRVMPALVEADETEADYVVSTHSHQDHLDADALPILVKNPRVHFIGSLDCEKYYAEAGVPRDRFTILHKDESLSLGDFTLTGVYADHGDLAPEALGFLFNFDGIKVWQVGDTAYRPDRWTDLFAQNVDIVLAPINGAFGNLNGVEAAKLAHDAHAKLVIPCHFWMFAQHLGSPLEFLEACKELAPEVQPMLLTQGERFLYQKRRQAHFQSQATVGSGVAMSPRDGAA
jgi:L-ascorbate 6-phosphate lactonase